MGGSENEGRGGAYLKRWKTKSGHAENEGREGAYLGRVRKRRERRHIPWDTRKTEENEGRAGTYLGRVRIKPLNIHALFLT